MMSVVRRMVRRVLAALAARTPAPRGEWARGMLAEADHLEDEGQATRWMLGGASLLTRQLVVDRLRSAPFGLGISLGLASAAGVVVLSMTAHDWLANAMRVSLSMPLFFVVIPEVLFGVGIALLWRRRRAAALGIAAGAAMLLTHATLHMLGR